MSEQPIGTTARPGSVQPISTTARPGNVQAIERAFTLLETIANNGGTMGLSAIAERADLPLPTIHRLVRTLVDLGYLRQDLNRHYVLHLSLTRLGESAARIVSVWAKPYLQHLADDLGESANLAMLDGDHIVYVAQAQSQRSMRTSIEVGGRVLPHSTAAGKSIMANMPRDDVRNLLKRTGMPALTDSTITTARGFVQALNWVAEHGYALDDGEQELGVRCVAVQVSNVPTPLAISVSGPTTRMTEDMMAQTVPLIQRAAEDLSRDLT